MALAAQRSEMSTSSASDLKFQKLCELFPGCVDAVTKPDGTTERHLDFSRLRHEIFSDRCDDHFESRLQLFWPGKRDAAIFANAECGKTLRPMRGESVRFDETQHLLVEGNNLDAMKLLQKYYAGKVDLITIDPPYNTGKDFVYVDRHAEDEKVYLSRSGQLSKSGERLMGSKKTDGRFHSKWISAIYTRLILAWRLLADTGSIWISIDDREQGHLQLICDEIFGATNFVNNVIWQKKNSPQNEARWLSDNHDFILVYAKNKEIYAKRKIHPPNKLTAKIPAQIAEKAARGDRNLESDGPK
jgi:adenine-specific DNA-methyltransferase